MTDTEAQNPQFAEIDRWPTQKAVEAMVEAQISAVVAIRTQIAVIAAASEAAADRLRGGGRLVYVGAGTSGRIAVQDGVELGPTFNWPEDRLLYLMAGGPEALLKSAEGAEDDANEAQRLVAAHRLNSSDVAIGIAASGRTPFTIAAVEAARTAGTLTIAIANNAGAPLLAVAEHAICVETGAEVIAGSTRMKAGTAQKSVANLLSTAIMLRLGRVYKGLMVDMVVSNLKLQHRAHGMVSALTGCSEQDAIRAVEQAGGDIKLAVLVALGRSVENARTLLAAHDGILRHAVEAL